MMITDPVTTKHARYLKKLINCDVVAIVMGRVIQFGCAFEMQNRTICTR